MRRLFSAVMLSATLSTAAAAQGITYAVNGTFSDGGTFSGFYSFDGANKSIVSSNIVSTSFGAFPESRYTSAGTGAPFVQGNDVTAPNDFTVLFRSESTPYTLFFWLTGTPATFTGGDILTVGKSCSACTPSRELNRETREARLITGGTVVAVPEPSSAALLVMGLGGLLVSRRRRYASR